MESPEKIEDGELQLLGHAELAYKIAEAHRSMVWGHLAIRYKLTPVDTVDDVTGEIKRFAPIQEGVPNNGNGVAPEVEAGANQHTDRPSLRIERNRESSKSAD